MSPEQALAQFERYRNDKFAFLTECCFTKDQVDSKNPIKLIPNDWPYLRLYVLIWERYRLVASPKSRRMTMSWTNIGLYLHDTIFNPVRDNAFVSKKEDDAGELVKRAEFMFDRIPEHRIPRKLLPKKETRAKPQTLSFPEIDSKITAYPMGADQLRQFTFSGILGDECAFWEDAQKFYAGAYPTIEGGGRMSLISSRSPGFFQRLVYDQLDSNDEIDETPPITPQYPFGDDSVMTWINPKNKFFIFDVHYTANPRKRAPAFRDAVKNSMPIKEYLVEYERNWEAFEGKPVFEDYDERRHATNEEVEPHLGLPLLLGWDFGLTPAAVVAQLREGQLFIICEFVAEHASIEKFCPRVMSELRVRFPEWNDMQRDFRHYIDPAGFDEAQTDSRTCAGIMSDCGLKNTEPGPLRWEARRKSVEHFLMKHTKEGPGLILNPKTSPVLHKGFKGGYRYPEKYAQAEPGKISPIKNHFSHPHDGLQYLCGGAILLSKKKTGITAPAPEYNFGNKQETRNRNGELA